MLLDVVAQVSSFSQAASKFDPERARVVSLERARLRVARATCGNTWASAGRVSSYEQAMQCVRALGAGASLGSALI